MNEMPFWKGLILVLAVTIFSMIIVAAALSILVFFIRKPLSKYKDVEIKIFEKLATQTSRLRNRVILFITFLGSPVFLVVANLVLLAFFLFLRRYSWFSIRIIVIALSSLVLMLFLKYLFKRKRPLSPLLKAAKGLSFPSGHSITAVTFYGLLIYIVFKTQPDGILKFIVAAVLILLIILIGFSRIYLRVHYVSDVLAGFIIGTLWLAVSLEVLNILEEYIEEKRKIPVVEMLKVKKDEMIVKNNAGIYNIPAHFDF